MGRTRPGIALHLAAAAPGECFFREGLPVLQLRLEAHSPPRLSCAGASGNPRRLPGDVRQRGAVVGGSGCGHQGRTRGRGTGESACRLNPVDLDCTKSRTLLCASTVGGPGCGHQGRMRGRGTGESACKRNLLGLPHAPYAVPVPGRTWTWTSRAHARTAHWQGFARM